MENQTKTICLNFKQELNKFKDSVHSLKTNGSLSSEERFLLNIAETIDKLYDSSVQVLSCQQDDVKEIGALVQNIFVQPLRTKKKEPITIRSAVESFAKEHANNSDLSAILHEYVTHPETTESFIRELELLSEDLDSAIERIA